MSQKERPLPDSAADRYSEFDNSIESFISDPAGPSTLQRVQSLEAEYAAQSAELKLLRDKYGIAESREELFSEMLDEEVERTKEFVYTEEGEQHIRNTILQDWAGLRSKSTDDYFAAFSKPQRERLRQEHKRFYPDEEE